MNTTAAQLLISNGHAVPTEYSEARALLNHLEHHWDDRRFIAEVGGAANFELMLGLVFDIFYDLGTK